MNIEILYRIDTSEYFETNSIVLRDTTWEAVTKEAVFIEAGGNTVISIRNLIFD